MIRVLTGTDDRRTPTGIAPARVPLAWLRSVVAGGVGLVAGIAVAFVVEWQAALLIGWIVAAVVNLGWTWQGVAGMSASQTRTHAQTEEPGRGLSEVIVLIAGVAMLSALGLALIRGAHAQGATKAYLVATGILSVIASWGTIHTIYALRYARAYYGRPKDGVDFHEADDPAYLDFAYLAFTIGMTFQVSDTDLTTKQVRRMALGHALLSYLFGAVLLALSINVVATLLS